MRGDNTGDRKYMVIVELKIGERNHIHTHTHTHIHTRIFFYYLPVKHPPHISRRALNCHLSHGTHMYLTCT